ncbi:MAG TPA: ATP-binding protein [Desulfuromonadales bacterium]|nr:ATP-binding protein [Desulfuromonadales bacterium]
MKQPVHVDPNLYAMVLENIDRGVVVMNQAGVVTLVNPSGEDFLGISQRHCLGRDVREFFQGQETILYLIRVALQEGRTISDDEGLLLQRPSQRPLPISIYAAPIFSKRGGQEGAVLIIRDLTRVQELERSLRRADRLSMLGTLAAGLAHEIKNPLGGVKGAAQLLSMELPEGSELREYTQVMVREVERINSIIEELMDLANPRPAEMAEVNLVKVLNDIILLQQEAARGKHISFSLAADPSLPPILGDESLLTRLFLNLVKNAGEAIEEEGWVRVEARVSADLHINSPGGGRPWPMAIIRISDNGSGIPQEELDRIFTPYFTTKIGGSGLGLAICQKIIEDHRGLLNISSNPGEGTIVTVSLPFRH